MPDDPPPRLRLRLPEGWRAVDPLDAGAHDAGFVAVHPGSADGFTANVTIGAGPRDADLPMERIADESVRRIARGRRVAILRRDEFGSQASPGIAQQLDIVTPTSGGSLRLIQCQVHIAMTHAEHNANRAVVTMTLTCTPVQLDTVFSDFQDLVGSVYLAAPSAPAS